MSDTPVLDANLIGTLARMPGDMRATFSDAQLQALNDALGTQPKRVHTVNLRWMLSFWRWNFYFIFLFGQDRRQLSRRQQQVERWALAIAIFLFVTVSTLFGLLILYLVKSAMGIDIFPHFSLGIWGWFKSHYL